MSKGTALRPMTLREVHSQVSGAALFLARSMGIDVGNARGSHLELPIGFGIVALPFPHGRIPIKTIQVLVERLPIIFVIGVIPR